MIYIMVKLYMKLINDIQLTTKIVFIDYFDRQSTEDFQDLRHQLLSSLLLSPFNRASVSRDEKFLTLLVFFTCRPVLLQSTCNELWDRLALEGATRWSLEDEGRIYWLRLK